MSFSHLEVQSPDPLLALIGEVRKDPRPVKIDLSVGVYRDEDGRTPVMAAVKQAERTLWVEQDSKSYLGPEGDEGFVAHLIPMVFGEQHGASVRGVQTPGGTGALRLAADLLAIGGKRRIWVGTPTWTNHMPVFAAAGLEVRTFTQFDVATQMLMPEAILAALTEAEAGDAVLLQACCHNPTGADPDGETWAHIVTTLAQRGLLPLIDAAYHGLGDGLEEDMAPLRSIVNAVPEALVAYSCNKNFGLYRDRVGALFATAQVPSRAELILNNAKTVARASYSMPPDHGAAVVRLILSDPALTALWREELGTMRARLGAVRSAVAGAAPWLEPVGRQKGMFSLLPIPRAMIDRLKAEHAIYMAPSGRINLAGMPLAMVDRFTGALAQVVQQKVA